MLMKNPLVLNAPQDFLFTPGMRLSISLAGMLLTSGGILRPYGRYPSTYPVVFGTYIRHTRQVRFASVLASQPFYKTEFFSILLVVVLRYVFFFGN